MRPNLHFFFASFVPGVIKDEDVTKGPKTIMKKKWTWKIGLHKDATLHQKYANVMYAIHSDIRLLDADVK